VSLRLRLIVAATSAVALAVLLVAVGAYITTGHELRHQVDVSLDRRLDIRPRLVQNALGSVDLTVPGRRFPGDNTSVQIVRSDGTVLGFSGVELPVSASDKQLAATTTTVTTHRDVRVSGVHLRVATRALGGGLAEMAASPLDTVDNTLHHLILLLALLALGGVAVAAGLGWLVAQAALAPVERLTAAAERVAVTRDLTETIPVHGADEVARLASTLNSMLVAVDESQKQQRRLVADASHELRTPLTSLRTNLEVLARSPDIADADRQALLGDLIDQVAELGTLVGQLVELDRSDVGAAEVLRPVSFDELVATAVTRARRNTPALSFAASLEPTVVVGLAGELERAASNLIDNAAKWSPPGGTVDVSLTDGVLRVRDHGPGIDPADLPHVFDRFYRSAAARGRPGSGLGLSIVRQAAEDHHGQAWIEAAPGGGTVACLAIPLATAAAPHTSGPPIDARPPAAPRWGSQPARDLAASTSPAATDASRQPSISAPFPGSKDL
jgi:two-component system sensor histidine kinase MprB